MFQRVSAWCPAMLATLAGGAMALAGPFPPSSNLAALMNGTDGFVVRGISEGDVSGRSVCAAGDVNGDGFDDVLIGGDGGDALGGGNAGRSYVVFGGPGVGAAGGVSLSALSASTGVLISGIDTQDFSGFDVSAAGDLNNDGVDDMLIGAYAADPGGLNRAGESYVVFGMDSSETETLGPAVELSLLNGVTGFALAGAQAEDFSGIAVASAGDVNGDDINDILIGAPGEPGTAVTAGKAFVVFGGAHLGSVASVSLATLNGTNGFTISGVHIGDQCGRSVSGAGDVNGDGIDDILIGAYRADTNGYSAGDSYVVFGRNTAVEGQFGASMNLSTLDGANGFTLHGVGTGDDSGFSVSSAGDVNGDGVEDILIGAYAPNAGETYVVFGRDTSIMDPFPASIELSDLNGANGFVLRGYRTGDQSGRAVSSAGDCNADGYADIIVGAWLADPDFRTNAGETYVVYGGPNAGATGSIDLANLDGTDGFGLSGIGVWDQSGTSVSFGGDINGDGISDLLIGAPNADPFGAASAGETYVVFGRVPDPCSGDVTGDGLTNTADFNVLAGHFGQSVPAGTLGDLTGDGLVNTADFNILAGNFGCGGVP